MFWPSIVLLVSLLGFASFVNAEVTFVQSDAKLTFAMYAMQNGSGHDLKMQLSAPMTAGWGSVGIGEEMNGALMFMIYPSSDSRHVTVSIRSAPGNVKPQELKGVDYSVEKTSISTDSTMLAQFTCYKCDTWPGGTLNMTSISAPWIYALGPNSPVHSDDTDTDSLQKHQKYNTNFYIDMPAAVTTMQNPTFSSMLPMENKDASISMNTAAGGMSTASSGGAESSSKKSSKPAHLKQLVRAHAILFGLSFAFLMPLAVIFLRFAGRYSFWLHAGVMALAITALVAAFPIAIYFSAAGGYPFTQAHKIVGTIAASSAIVFQPALGWYHHIRYKKIGRRTIASHIHMWTGRIVPLLGTINIILGCLLAAGPGDKKIAIGTGVTGLFIYVVVFSAAAWEGYTKRGRAEHVKDHSPESPDMCQKS